MVIMFKVFLLILLVLICFNWYLLRKKRLGYGEGRSDDRAKVDPRKVVEAEYRMLDDEEIGKNENG